MNNNFKNNKVFIAGHKGMVGSSILRLLQKKNYSNLLTADRNQLDLINQMAVSNYFTKEKPDIVILAAAKVGGINANNKFKGEFIYENLMIQNNIIHSAMKNNVKKLIFLGSSCIYPKNSSQPIKEEYLLTGELEKTNEPYAIAKIAGLKLCESYNFQYKTNYICLMPTNLYGPNDNYDPENSHVIGAIIRKIHEAKIYKYESIVMWGSGRPRREFLHVDDLARACLFFIEKDCVSKIYNVGYGEDISIEELYYLLMDIIGYKCKIIRNKSMPDGTPRKLLDISKIKEIGWAPSITLKKGLAAVYKEFEKAYEKNKSTARI
jgi:GDP-L-fucose synthase